MGLLLYELLIRAILYLVFSIINIFHKHALN